ncbi:MAG TPA: ABC transporter ATP-binding protein [Nitrospiraceae bacterium]|nr:ABC transporter ATP-binding protein [Nitrospiraceae bacterium]
MFILKLVLRNTFRHTLRTSLTILSIIIALVAFGLLRTVINSWYAGVDASSASRLVTRNAISLMFPLPLSYRDKIRAVDGVKTVSYGNWFGGIYKDRKNFFANFAVDPKTYFQLNNEFMLTPEEHDAFIRDRKGFVAGRKLAKKFGWKIGDSVPLEGTIFPGSWEFVLRGIYKGKEKNTDESLFFFHWEYLNETLRKTMPLRADKVGFYMVGVKDPARAVDVTVAIDRIFKNSLAETLTETEKAFQLSFISMSEAVIIAIRLVSLVVIIIIMAVAANTMAMTVRERTREYAVFKTLGFGAFRITAMIFGESLLITMTGCVLGIVLTYPAAGAFGRALGDYFPIFEVDNNIFTVYVGASLLVGVTAAVLPAWKAIRITIAEGLRRIE